MPVCGGDGKEGNVGLSTFWGGSALIYSDHDPGTPGPDQIGDNVTPLGGSAGCHVCLQYLDQNAEEGPVQKGCRCRPAVRLKGKECKSGCHSNCCGMIQLVPTKSRRSRAGRHQCQPENQQGNTTAEEQPDRGRTYSSVSHVDVPVGATAASSS